MKRFSNLLLRARASRPVYSTHLFHTSAFTFNAQKSGEVDPQNTLARLRQNENVPKVVSQTLDNLKFKALTNVQDASIASAITSEKGVVVRAKTGTGKTLAYLIPILSDLIPLMAHNLKNKNKVFHLIIVPTRDLAQQIQRELTTFVKGHPDLKPFLSRSDVITGSTRSNLDSLMSPSIVIATPGKLIKTLENYRRLGKKFTHLRSVVLDEADRLLDAGFGADIEAIDSLLRDMNASNETGGDLTFRYLLYSATIDKNVSAFAKDKIDKDFKFIDCVQEDATEAHENIKQTLVKTRNFNESIHGSMAYSVKRLSNEELFKGIIFLPTVRAVDFVYDTMKASCTKLVGRKVFKVHGQMTQAARDRSLLNYRRSVGGLLVCTDVAARGLDFPDITTVIQTTASIETASYIHKIGRTGRAGKTGESILFNSPAEANFVRILKKEKQIEFNEEIEYNEMESDKDLLRYRSDEELIDETVKSICLFYTQAANAHKLDKLACLKGVLGFFQEITDLSDKINLSRSLLQIVNLPRDEAEMVFEVPRDYRPVGKVAARGRFNKFDNNKSKDYGRNRGSSSRGGYNPRGSNHSRDNFNNRSYSRGNSRDNYSRDDSRNNYSRDNRSYSRDRNSRNDSNRY